MPISPSLAQAYLRTSFQADTPMGKVSIRCNEHNSALDALLGRHGAQAWAYVTAYNPGSRKSPDAGNLPRQAALIERLKGRFPMYFGHGIGDDGAWPAEPSILVIGISADEACQIGREFGQNAIVVGRLGGRAQLCDLT